MMPFRVVHSASEDWANAAKALADGVAATDDGANLGFLYASDPLPADISSILTFLRQKTDIEHWVGCGAAGVMSMPGTMPGTMMGDIADDYDRPAAVAMVGKMTDQSFRVIQDMSETSSISEWLATEDPYFGIVHGESMDGSVPDGLQDLSGRFAFLVGGLTSSIHKNTAIADGATTAGLSGVLFSSGLGVATGLSQGCLPISDMHEVTDCQDNVVIGLNGQPALEVFTEAIGKELAADLPGLAGLVHAAVPVEGSDTGDYMVRSLLGIDPKRGMLAIADDIRIGTRLMFVRRDAESAREDLRQMVADLKGRMDAPPRGGIYISCMARGPSLFGKEGVELEIIRDGLGDVPLVGFYGNGEISNARLYGYTGVLTLFL
ncbi:MAG: histidine kinase [Rhodospirillaceae bacterium]|jgi:small ligand-binding sensory domain FIST|nr:histidine kinase [Rhodospirillaceae bacterium]MBT4218992.1 histidine kinase [Rhodospirillaceae bacterium]MBT5012928.1 histidine kinase [Rhodospirillaceae bacterium]MBT5307934.1 histidine kinase [Rhodospirillaceae bacterium]MBT6407408.1 histidine kinase [Rhodospirillaceae bacterium]